MITLWGTLSVIFFTSLALFSLLYISSKSNALHFDIRLFILFYILIAFRLIIPLEMNIIKTFHSNKLLVNLNEILNFQMIGFISVGQLFISIWLIGLIYKLGSFIKKTYKTYITFKVYPNRHINSSIQEEIKKVYPKIRRIRIIVSSLVPVPMVYGFFNATVILPEQNYTEEEFIFILQHEFIHVAHYHVWIKLITEIIYIIYWWNPLILFTRKRVNELLEKETDLQIITVNSKEKAIRYTEFLIRTFTKQKTLTSIETSKYGKIPLISEFINTNRTSEFYSRCKTIVTYDPKKKGNSFHFIKYFIYIMGIMAMTTLVIQPEYSIPEDADYFELTEDSAYLKLTKDGYDIYYNNEYIYSIDKNLEGYENLPIKK